MNRASFIKILSPASRVGNKSAGIPSGGKKKKNQNMRFEYEKIYVQRVDKVK